jgi:hypothetical protein
VLGTDNLLEGPFPPQTDRLHSCHFTA